MIAVIAGMIGPRFAKPVFWSLVFLFIAGLIFTLGRCSHDGGSTNSAQAIQTGKSTAAAYEGASEAIDTMGKGQARDAALDAATAATKGTINEANSLGAIDSAVTDGLCRSPARRHDAKCQLRGADPR